MGKNRFSSEDAGALRSKILTVISEADAPVGVVLTALTQCQEHLKNRMIVEQAIKDCGFRSGALIASEYLELCFDIEEEKQKIAHIAKGWGDPGFRVGHAVEVPKWRLEALKEHALALLKYCATRGVTMTVEENDDDSVKLLMDSVIYSDGFNKKVLVQVLESLKECTTKAQNLFFG